MILSSLAVLALSAVANPFTHIIHMHPKQPDTRVTLTLRNDSMNFRDVKIDGQAYTVRAHGAIDIKAPIGTVVYADSQTLEHKRGDAILEVTPKLANQQVTLD